MFPYVCLDGFYIKEEEGEIKIWSITGLLSANTVGNTAFEFTASLNYFLLSR